MRLEQMDMVVLYAGSDVTLWVNLLPQEPTMTHEQLKKNSKKKAIQPSQQEFTVISE